MSERYLHDNLENKNILQLQFQNIDSEASTEYIHFIANSIALRQLMIQEVGSIYNIFSAAIATSENVLNFGSF